MKIDCRTLIWFTVWILEIHFGFIYQYHHFVVTAAIFALLADTTDAAKNAEGDYTYNDEKYGACSFTHGTRVEF